MINYILSIFYTTKKTFHIFAIVQSKRETSIFQKFFNLLHLCCTNEIKKAQKLFV